MKPRNPRKEERNRRALELKRAGKSYPQIAAEMGLCLSRAWIIVNNQARWEREAEAEKDG